METPFPRAIHTGMQQSHFHEMGQRRFGSVNWGGVATLYYKEILRSVKVPAQTFAAPVITALLFLFIFSYAFGASRPSIGDIPLTEFLIPGLAMMALMQNAFACSSSSLLISKMMGITSDFLMPPLSPGELAVGFVGGATTRGVAVATCVIVGVWLFHTVEIKHPWAVLYFALGGSLMLGQMGLLAGIWSGKFDHLQSVTNFVIMPLSFLSGTFYPIHVLPPAGQTVSLSNPFFYLIDGFRYGFLGYHESNLLGGVILIAGINVALWLLCYRALRSGWRLKT
ncbi:MAG: ABC transporter permease [Hyphomicrobiales bacterium]|nr:ABC transporter permease [Hyphomicrobiales bacterium]